MDEKERIQEENRKKNPLEKIADMTVEMAKLVLVVQALSGIKKEKNGTYKLPKGVDLSTVRFYIWDKVQNMTTLDINGNLIVAPSTPSNNTNNNTNNINNVLINPSPNIFIDIVIKIEYPITCKDCSITT